jgi:hypothetical protein
MRQRGRPRTAPATGPRTFPPCWRSSSATPPRAWCPRAKGRPAPADVLQRVLMQRNQMAHDLVAGLQRSLGRTLESVQQALPLAEPSSTVRDLAFRGLPAPDLSALRPRLKASRPWCAALLPDVAAWLTRRDLQGRLGPEIREQLALHDRQLQAWLRAQPRAVDRGLRGAGGGLPRALAAPNGPGALRGGRVPVRPAKPGRGPAGPPPDRGGSPGHPSRGGAWRRGNGPG